MKNNRLKLLATTLLCSTALLSAPAFYSNAAANSLPEIGDAIDSAFEISAHTDYSAAIDYAEDTDFYSFTPSSEGTYGCFYSFNLKNHSVTSHAVYRLYDKNMQSVASFSAVPVGTNIKTSKIVALQPGERYYLTVSSGSKTVDSGNYEFNISTIADDVPNSISLSELMQLNTMKSGTIQCLDDTDIFRINTGSHRMLAVNVTNNSDTTTNIVCKVLNANGSIISQGSASDGNTYCTNLTQLATNTDYFIQITGPEGAKYTVNPTPLQKKITYHLNGGTNSSKNPSTYVCGTQTTLSDPTKEGYEFKGWYKTAYFGNKVTSISTTETSDLHLYAKWEKRTSGKIVRLKKKKATSNSITLTWSKVSKATGYEVYRGSKKVLDTTRRSCTLKNLTSAKEYTLKVRSYRVYKSGTAYGKFKSIHVCTLPKAPSISYTKGESTSFFKGQLSISWTTQSRVDGYQIYVSNFRKFGYLRKGTVEANTNVYTIENLFKKGYWVRVRAFKETDNGIVYGPYSTPVKAYAKN